MTSTSDLAGLFAEPSPASSAMTVRYRQGTIVEFDGSTLENTVRVGDTVYTNLPLLGVAEAATLTPGAVVGLHLLGDKTQTWAIVGRIVTPGSQQAIDAITQLSQRIVSASLLTSDSTTSVSNYVDLSSTYGPEVTALIGVSGRALILLSADVNMTINSAVPADGQFSYAISGPGGDVSADTIAGFGTSGQQSMSLTTTGFVVNTTTYVTVQEGLTPGLTKFTMKYRSSLSSLEFSHRNITVFAL